MTRVIVAGMRDQPPRADAETLALVGALAERDVDAVTAPWDDIEGAEADLVVVRTTWDYTARRSEFLSWARRQVRLRNPLPVLDWNSHKGYLLELAAAGVPTVPTTLVPRGSALDLGAGAGRVVVKPAVAAGGRGARLGTPTELAGVAEEDVLVQPAVEGIGRDGEVSLVRLGDTWSHAVRKVPAPGGFLVHERHGGTLADHTPTDAEVAVAEKALSVVPAPVSYARVDLVRLDGAPVVMELELVEPELFLRRVPAAAGRLADALLATL